MIIENLETESSDMQEKETKPGIFSRIWGFFIYPFRKNEKNNTNNELENEGEMISSVLVTTGEKNIASNAQGNPSNFSNPS